MSKKIAFIVCGTFLYAVMASSAYAKSIPSVDQVARQQFKRVSAVFGPSQPSQPSLPSQPSQPSIPNGNHGTVQPIYPGYPGQTVYPGYPANPVQPVSPYQPYQPPSYEPYTTQPIQPSPAYPVHPNPYYPVQPVQPNVGAGQPLYPTQPVSFYSTDPGASLVYSYNNVKNALYSLKSNVRWVKSDISRLESKARRIQSSNKPDSFFVSDLRKTARDVQRHESSAQRIYWDVQSLLNSAVPSAELNRIARDMDYLARDLERSAQFDIEWPAQNLERLVRSIDSNLVGISATFAAGDIARNARNLRWKARDIMWRTSDLVNKTNPQLNR